MVLLAVLTAGAELTHGGIVRLDFSGEWVSDDAAFFGVDSPWNVGDGISGYFVYDDTATLSDEDAVSSFSLTFDGLGTIAWEAGPVPPSLQPAVLTGFFGSTWIVIAPSAANGWTGPLDLLTFDISAPGIPPGPVFGPWTIFDVGLTLVPSSPSDSSFYIRYQSFGDSFFFGQSRASVASSSSTPIPEPGGLILLVGGLGLMVIASSLRRAAGRAD